MFNMYIPHAPKIYHVRGPIERVLKAKCGVRHGNFIEKVSVVIRDNKRILIYSG